MQLRYYQQDVKQRTNAAWRTHRNVLVRLPTGAGKTVLFSSILADCVNPVVAVAHRQELVSQISLSLAAFGLTHTIIAPKAVVHEIVKIHTRELGRSFYNANAPCAVAGVDTLIRRGSDLDSWRNSVELWVMDEGHHVLRDNKWGKAVRLFPNARGLSVTATVERADGRGLGSHSDGVIDTIIDGPSMRHLIDEGYLTDYRLFAPPSDMQLDDLKTTATGDFSGKQLRERSRSSHIVGDVVSHYQRIAPGKLGVTFCTDVDTAESVAAQFNASGVPAAMVNAKTPMAVRQRTIEAFRNRQLLQLVNVDLFGEGFDLPAIEVVSFARPTASYAVYAQQFGRALRPMPDKTHAIIIDHVSNVQRHGLPDVPRQWTLDARERSQKKRNAPTMRTCHTCTALFGVLLGQCPYCGAIYVPAERSTPQQVDGDLLELTAEALAELRAATTIKDPVRTAANMARAGVPERSREAAMQSLYRKRWAQDRLRRAIEMWAGWHKACGQTDGYGYRLFYQTFGKDPYTAMAGTSNEMLDAAGVVWADLERVSNGRVGRTTENHGGGGQERLALVAQ